MVWNEALVLLNLQVECKGVSLDDDFSTWWRSKSTKAYKVITFIITWGIWIARNYLIFKDITKIRSKIAIKSVGIAEHFLVNPKC